MIEEVGASVEGLSGGGMIVGAGEELVGVTTKVSVISTVESSEKKIEVAGTTLVEMLADVVWGRTIVKITYVIDMITL